MKQLLFLIGGLALPQAVAGQTCTHTDLSETLTFSTALTERIGNPSLREADSHPSVYFKSYEATLNISTKLTNKPPQLIRFYTGPLFSAAYQNCNAARSYSTGKNRDADATDNDYGDLIVADFNFDGRDDFAAKSESGGNAGPYYNYYVQLSSGEFVLDEFLTVEMQFFPDDISRTRRTLTTRVHAGADGLGETVFRLSKAGKWAQVSHRILPVK